MIDGLGDDIARAIRDLRGNSELLRLDRFDSKPAWSYRSALRAMLSARISDHGLTPLVDVAVYDWRLDAVAVQGRMIRYAFLLRWNDRQDYRCLLLFPSSIVRVLISMTESAVPENPHDLTVVVVPSIETVRSVAGKRLSVTDVQAAWERGYRLAYGMECPVPRRHRTVAATKVVSFWEQRGNGRDLGEYMAYFLTRRGTRGREGALPRITEAIDLQALAEFDARARRSSREFERENDEWARKGGWSAPLDLEDGSGF